MLPLSSAPCAARLHNRTPAHPCSPASPVSSSFLHPSFSSHKAHVKYSDEAMCTKLINHFRIAQEEGFGILLVRSGRLLQNLSPRDALGRFCARTGSGTICIQRDAGCGVHQDQVLPRRFRGILRHGFTMRTIGANGGPQCLALSSYALKVGTNPAAYLPKNPRLLR